MADQMVAGLELIGELGRLCFEIDLRERRVRRVPAPRRCAGQPELPPDAWTKTSRGARADLLDVHVELTPEDYWP